MLSRNKSTLLFIFLLKSLSAFANYTCPLQDPFREESIGFTLDSRNEIRSQNLEWVRECAAIAPDKTFSISYFRDALCRYPDSYHGNKIGYRLKKLGAGFRINTRIGLVPSPDDMSEELATELMDAIRACEAPIQEVWSRYGIELQIDFGLTKDKNDSQFDHAVFLHQGDGRSDTSNLYTQDSNLCQVILHEVGHLLGLDDEYSDDDCPNRPLISEETLPISVMNQHFHPFDMIDFFVRHIMAILAPVCGGEGHIGRVKTNADVVNFIDNTVWTSLDGEMNATFVNATLTDSEGQTFVWRRDFSPSWMPELFNPEHHVAAHSLLLARSNDNADKRVISISSMSDGQSQYCFMHTFTNFSTYLCL